MNNLYIIENITNFLLFIAIMLSSFIYLTHKVNNNFIESSLKGILWIFKQIIFVFVYWLLIIILFPFRVFLKFYLILTSLILKLIQMPIRSFLKYGRRIPLNILWDEVELYFYYSTREALGYWNWLRKLSIKWVDRVAPDFILNTLYGKSKLFIWGYLIRYVTIFVIFCYLKIKQNIFIFLRRLLLLDFFYTIYFFIFYFKEILKRKLTNSFIWHNYVEFRRSLFFFSSHWLNFHTWMNFSLGHKWFAIWKLKNNLEDWNHPRWLFQPEYTLEELQKFNFNNQFERDVQLQTRYSLLKWILLLLMILLYNILGILCFILLPINIYLFIFRNEQQVKKHYNIIKLNFFNLLSIVLGKNWFLYLPAGLYWAIFWVVNSVLRWLPAITFFIMISFVKFLWKIRVLILFIILSLIVMHDIQYSKILSTFILSNLWFSWMFWLDFSYYTLDLARTGTYLDVWHPGNYWNPNMRGTLFVNYYDIIVEKWIHLMTVDPIKEKVYNLRKWHHQKLAWDYIRTTMGWTTGFYYRRIHWNLDWRVWRYKIKAIITVTLGGTSHWWWYTYLRLNGFYKFCLLLTFIKNIMLIPIQSIGISNGKFIKNNGVVGDLFNLIETIFIYCFNNLIILLKKIIPIIINYISSIDFIKFFSYLLKFYYKSSFLNFVNNYNDVNIILYENSLYWNWYLNIIFIDFYNDIKTLNSVNPILLNFGVFDFIMYTLSLYRNTTSDILEIKAKILSYFIYPLYKHQLNIDKIYINLEVPLTLQGYINENENELEASKLNTVFRTAHVAGRKMFYNSYWINDFDDYLEGLDSITLAHEFYARREYNWDEKSFLPFHLLWYDQDNNNPIIIENFFDKRKFFWVWFENKHWWWVYYRGYKIKDFGYFEVIRKYASFLFKIVTFTLWKWYYFLLIALFLFNQGFRDYLNNEWLGQTYLTNREMAWRIFRSQKPKNLEFLYIDEEQKAILKNITNITSKKKDITKLNNKLLFINLNKEFSEQLVKNVNKKLEKDSIYFYKRKSEMISWSHFNYYFEPKFDSFRNSIGLYHDYILGFIAFYYGRDHFIKKAWSQYDNIDYQSVYHLTYDEKLVANYMDYWNNNILNLENINQRWFKGNLKSWLLPREFESFEIIISTSKEGDKNYEFEDNEMTYLPHTYYFWFIVFPFLIFYQAFAVQISVSWSWVTFGNYYAIDYMAYSKTLLSHFSWLNEVFWMAPESLPSEKDAGNPTLVVNNTFIGDYYRSNYEDYFLITTGNFYQKGQFDLLSNYVYRTKQDAFDTIDELKFFEIIRAVVVIILMLLVTIFKANKKTINKKPLTKYYWNQIRDNIRKLWFWK